MVQLPVRMNGRWRGTSLRSKMPQAGRALPRDGQTMIRTLPSQRLGFLR